MMLSCLNGMLYCTAPLKQNVVETGAILNE